MTTSVQGAASSAVAELNHQKIQDFKDGKINIKKDDLIKTVKDTIAQGGSVSSDLMDLVDSYEKIDKDGDGISYKEYTTYKNTPAGILSSLGLSNSSVNNSVNSSLFRSINQQPSLLDYMTSDNSSGTSVFTGSESSYFNSLIQNYSSSGTGTNSSNMNLADYIS
jgi:hypothetical protein